MGNPQPLKMPEQNVPSFVPRTSKAMRIQRVTFPWEQQFIKTSCVYRRAYVFSMISMHSIDFLRFFFLIHHILPLSILCVKSVAVGKNLILPFFLLLKLKKSGIMILS